MVGALGRLYGRMGRYYGLLLPAFAMPSSFVLLAVVVYVAVRRFLGLPIPSMLHILWIGGVGVEVGIVITFVITLRKRGAVYRWVGGDHSPETASAAWDSAAQIPGDLIRYAAPLVSCGAIPALVVLHGMAHASWYSFSAIVIGCAVVVALGISLNIVAIETILRPVLLEIDSLYPSSGHEAHHYQASLRFRIIGSGLCVVYISAWLATALTSHTKDPAAQLALTIVGGLSLAFTFGVVLALALSQSIFGPVRALRDAAVRIGQGDLTVRVPHVTTDELGDLARRFNEMTEGLAERQALYSALGTYVDPLVADRLLREGQVLQGEEVDATIMFVDIVGFTARSETRHPAEIVEDLNVFFQLLLPVVNAHGGHTNKLLGDGFMAVFGAPVVTDDHADRALNAAMDMQDRMRERYGTGLQVGVGLNSGPVVVGTTGGASKLDFTVIGDAVNVASRVEALTRTTGDRILLTETTKAALRRPVALSHRGTSPVRGRAEPVDVYTPLRGTPG